MMPIIKVINKGPKQRAKKSAMPVNEPSPDTENTTPPTIANDVAIKEKSFISFPNVPGQVSPLAFGTKGCFAADVPKVPKAWGLTASARSALLFGNMVDSLKLI